MLKKLFFALCSSAAVIGVGIAGPTSRLAAVADPIETPGSLTTVQPKPTKTPIETRVPPDVAALQSRLESAGLLSRGKIRAELAKARERAESARPVSPP